MLHCYLLSQNSGQSFFAMMNARKRKSQVFSMVIGLALCLFGCQAYHDTTSRYNAYFLADQRMEEVEQKLFAFNDQDYNDVLQVLVPLDTNSAKSMKADLDYCIEKGSLPIV